MAFRDTILTLSVYSVTYMPQYVCKKSLTFHMIDVALSRFLYISSAINPLVSTINEALMKKWKLIQNLSLLNQMFKAYTYSLNK